MLCPVRCWSCGKPIAQFWEEFKQRSEKGELAQKIFDDLGIQRYCCRAILLGHVDLIDSIGQFKK